jgi:hypothetical protein
LTVPGGVAAMARRALATGDVGWLALVGRTGGCVR